MRTVLFRGTRLEKHVSSSCGKTTRAAVSADIGVRVATRLYQYCASSLLLPYAPSLSLVSSCLHSYPLISFGTFPLGSPHPIQLTGALAPTSVSPSSEDALPPTSLLLRQLLAAQRASASSEQLQHMAYCSKSGGGEYDTALLCKPLEPVRVYKPTWHTLFAQLKCELGKKSGRSTSITVYLGRYGDDNLSLTAFSRFVRSISALSAPDLQAVRFIATNM